MKKVEIVLVASIILLFVFYLIGFNVEVILSLVIVLLIIFYLIFSFALFNNIGLGNVFKKQSYAHISSKRLLGTIGIGFVMFFYLDIFIVAALHYIPLSIMRLPETIVMGAPVGYVALRYFKAHDAFYIPILKRIGIAYAVVIIFTMLPCHFTQIIRHRNNPDYLAFIDWIETQRMTDELNALKEYKQQQADSTLAALPSE